jgi:hypothetical protein
MGINPSDLAKASDFAKASSDKSLGKSRGFVGFHPHKDKNL